MFLLVHVERFIASEAVFKLLGRTAGVAKKFDVGMRRCLPFFSMSMEGAWFIFMGRIKCHSLTGHTLRDLAAGGEGNNQEGIKIWKWVRTSIK